MPENETIIVNAYPTLKEQAANLVLGYGIAIVATTVSIGALILVGAVAEKINNRRKSKKNLDIFEK